MSNNKTVFEGMLVGAALAWCTLLGPIYVERALWQLGRIASAIEKRDGPLPRASEGTSQKTAEREP